MKVRDFVIQYALNASVSAAVERSPAKPEDIIQDALSLWEHINEAVPEVPERLSPPRSKLKEADKSA